MKDVTAFRERFKAYKNGKTINEIYNLPGYTGGKSLMDTRNELAAYERFVDDVIREEGFLAHPKDIGDGMMTVGSGLTRQKWLDLYRQNGNVWTQADNRRAVKEELAEAEKYLRTVFPDYDSYPQGVKEVLQDIQYNTGKVNMKNSPKFVTAVREGNWGEAARQMDWGNRDPKFGKGLRARNQRRRDKWFSALGVDTDPNVVLSPDATNVVTTIPQEQTVSTYSPDVSPYVSGKPTMWEIFERNKPIKLPNLMDIVDDSQYRPKFNLVPEENDTNFQLPGHKNGKAGLLKFATGKPDDDYPEGTVTQGTKGSPASRVRNKLHPKPTDSELVRYLKNTAAGMYDDVAGLFEPYVNIDNGRGTVDDYIDVGLDLGAGLGAKLVRRTTKALKPPKKSVIKSRKLTPTQIGEYHQAHPELVKPVKNNKQVEEVVDFINNDIAPRYAKQNKVQIGVKPEDINIGSADLSSAGLGGYASPNGQIVIDNSILNDPNKFGQVVAHEVGGHWVDQKHGLNPMQVSQLQQGYPFKQEFLQERPWFPMDKEQIATNREFKYLVSRDNDWATGKELDNIIKNMPNNQVKRYVSQLGYSTGLNLQWPDLMPLKNAATSVPAIGLGLYYGDNRVGQYKNGKLPRFQDGYTEFKNSLPPNQRNTPEFQYNTRRYWELNGKPKNFAEAIGKGMYNYDFSDYGWHANSVAFNEKTGEYEFMKPNHHTTKMMEDAWYWSKDGEDFRKDYLKVPGIIWDKYVPKKVKIGFANGKLPEFKDGYRYVQNDNKSWSRITDDDVANNMENLVVTPYGVRNKFDYEYNPNYVEPIGKQATIQPTSESLRIKQEIDKINNTRTWRSDAADVMHSIGEGAMIASAFATPELEPIVANAAKNIMWSNPNSLLSRNIRTSFFNRKTPFAYNWYDPNNFIPYIDGSFNTLIGRTIKQNPIPIKLNGISATPSQIANRYAAWGKYLGINNDLPLYSEYGLNIGPYFSNGDGTFGANLTNTQNDNLVENLIESGGKQLYDAALFNHGGMGYKVAIRDGADSNTFPAELQYFDRWDLQPLKEIKWLPKKIRDFEASQALPAGAKPFEFRGRTAVWDSDLHRLLETMKRPQDFDKINYGTNAQIYEGAALAGGISLTPPAYHAAKKLADFFNNL